MQLQMPPATSTALDLSKVFVVHGHDSAPKAEVARFIEKLGFEPIILHERPNKGRALITKFREEAAGVGFAVVLMTPDDLGKAEKAVDLNPRARQNVIFELGFFIGKLGPERVAALVKGDIELPSDFDGVVYISLDKEDWQAKLGRELQDSRVRNRLEQGDAAMNQLVPITSARSAGARRRRRRARRACASSNSSPPTSATRTRAGPMPAPPMNSWPGARAPACRRSPPCSRCTSRPGSRPARASSRRRASSNGSPRSVICSTGWSPARSCRSTRPRRCAGPGTS